MVGKGALKVLVFHPALAPYRIDLFNALAEQVNLRLVFLHKNVPSQFYNQSKLLERLRAEYRYLERGFSVLGRDFRLGILQQVVDWNPDVIVTHEFSPLTWQIIISNFRRHLPHVVWTADSPSVIAAEYPLRKIARKIALRRINGLIVYSEETRNYYSLRFGFNRPIGVCPNAQHEDWFRQKLRNALPLSRELVRSHDLAGKKIVLYVGRLARSKRVDRLIRAFADICQDRLDTILVLVGDGPERASLEREVERINVGQKVIFPGHCEDNDLHAWFNIGCVFALASEFEPWGAVVNEALISGMPVICSSEAGARVLINPNANGTVIDAGSNSELKRSLELWLRRVGVANIDDTLRPSLMSQRFDHSVRGFISALDGAVVKPEVA